MLRTLKLSYAVQCGEERKGVKNKNIRNEPELRFPGFEGEWEKCKVRDIATTTIGEFVIKSKQNDSYPYPVYNGGRTNTGFYDKYNNEGNKILVSARGNAGFVNIIKTRYWAGNSCYSIAIIDKNKNDVDFAYYEMKLKENIFIKNQQSATIPSVSKSAVENFELLIPLIQEQTKIGSFLATIDALISETEKELEACREQKHGMLQKMFPKNGEKVPEIRFPEFTGDWEQRKLGDTVQITMGQSPDGSTYSDVPSDYILVQGNADLQNGWVSPRVWTSQMTKKADAGDLIMSVRAPAGAMGKTAYNAVIGRGVAAIKGNEFIYQLLVKMDADGFWKTLSCGSTFESLNSDNIKNAEVKTPTIAEQIKIGSYFKQLDNLITLHQRELDKLIELKKGFMQKMFC